MDPSKAHELLEDAGGDLEQAVARFLDTTPTVFDEDPSAINKENILRLTDIGFDYETAKTALEASVGDFEKALDQLLSA